MEPSLTDAIDRLTVVTGPATYEVGVMSKRDPMCRSRRIGFEHFSDGARAAAMSVNIDEAAQGGGISPRAGRSQ